MRMRVRGRGVRSAEEVRRWLLPAFKVDWECTILGLRLCILWSLETRPFEATCWSAAEYASLLQGEDCQYTNYMWKCVLKILKWGR